MSDLARVLEAGEVPEFACCWGETGEEAPAREH